MKKVLRILALTLVVMLVSILPAACDLSSKKETTDTTTKYTVTFNTQDGNNATLKRVVKGSTVEEYIPTRAGYGFIGWYTQDGEMFDFSTPINYKLTLLAEWTDEPYTYEFTDESETQYAITEYTGNAEVLVLPKAYNGLPVTKVNDAAFYDNDTLKSITISSSITELGAYITRNCQALTTIKVDPKNIVYTSRNQRGKECNGIVNAISNSLVLGCKNTEIPDGVASIAAGAFAMCKNLSLTVPSSVTRIGGLAFWDCSIATSLTFLAKTIDYIDAYAFNGCRGTIRFGCQQSQAQTTPWDTNWNGGAGNVTFVWNYTPPIDDDAK